MITKILYSCLFPCTHIGKNQVHHYHVILLCKIWAWSTISQFAGIIQENNRSIGKYLETFRMGQYHNVCSKVSQR